MTSYPAGSALIYFFGEEDRSAVKVGKTRQASAARRMQHEQRGPDRRPMKFLAGVLGSDSDETAIKRRFHANSVNGSEWLRPDAALLGYLRWLRDQTFVATSEEQVMNLPLVASQAWLPDGPARMKEFVEQRRLPFDTDGWDSELGTPDLTDGDFYSPPSWTAAARDVMGGIDLDPASCREANREVQATRFYGNHEDGLLQPWAGRVWLNPPFGNWAAWGPKALAEIRRGAVTEMCVLMSTRAVTAQAAHDLISACHAFLIPRGRARFWGPKAGSPDEGHLVFYWGSNADRFAERFASIGKVWRE